MSKQDIMSKIKQGQQGLPQGDAIAPFIARSVLGREVQLALQDWDVAWGSHLDDLVIGARSQQDLAMAVNALTAHLGGLPAGPLKLHKTVISDVDKGFEFAGYLIRGEKFVDGLHVRPTNERFGKFKAQLWKRLNEAETALAHEFRVTAFKYAKNWYNAHSNWTKTEASWAHVVANVEELLNYFFYMLYMDGFDEIESHVDFDSAEASAPKFSHLKLM